MAIQKTEGLETTTTMLAYYNAAVESEYLCQWDQAQQNHLKALQVSIKVDDKKTMGKIKRALAFVNMKVRNRVQRSPLRPLISLQ